MRDSLAIIYVIARCNREFPTSIRRKSNLTSRTIQSDRLIMGIGHGFVSFNSEAILEPLKPYLNNLIDKNISSRLV
jgi:hypothetical protein